MHGLTVESSEGVEVGWCVVVYSSHSSPEIRSASNFKSFYLNMRCSEFEQQGRNKMSMWKKQNVHYEALATDEDENDDEDAAERERERD